MSTKTTLKRIALVAVSALGFGLMSIIPAQAATLDTGDVTSVAPANASIAKSATVTTRLNLNSDGNIGDLLDFDWNTGGVTDNADFSWKILEHSTNVYSNAYQGASTDNFKITWNSTTQDAYVLIQVRASGADIADQLILETDTDNADQFTLDIADTYPAADYPTSISNATDTPWRIQAILGTSFVSKTDLANLSGKETVVDTTGDVRIEAVGDTVQKAGSGSYRYVEVTGSTIKAVAGAVVIDGVANTATKALVQTTGDLLDGATGAQVWVNATASGTISVKFYDRSVVALTGAVYDTLLQTLTFTITAPGEVSRQTSTAYLHAEHDETTGVATDQDTYPGYLGDFDTFDCDTSTATVNACDFTVLAPAVAAPAAADARAVIQVKLKDALSVAAVGTLPAIGASIAGPGTLSISNTLGGAGSQGRSLSVAAPTSSTFYIHVFSDGTAGTGTISILVGGSVWKTKMIKFYSDIAKVEAAAGLTVIRANATSGCKASLAACAIDSTTASGRVAVQVVASDANGTPVPFRTYKQVSSDATILVGNATAAAGQPTLGQSAHYLGASWFQVTTMPSVDSGKSATMTYTTAPTATTTLSTTPVKFTIGGGPSTAALSVTAGKSVGEKGSMTINVTDAAGNAIYDSDHSVSFTTNIALASGTGLLSGTGPIAVLGGKASIEFFNPVVPGTVTVKGLVSGVLPIAGSFTVTNASQDAATDAALNAQKEVLAAIAAAEAASDAAAEAIDAANAATDAANLAAEAADAATVAAEEARDAADAATAAVEELATQVAALMAALKAQITTLANTVAKIAKKVKA